MSRPPITKDLAARALAELLNGHAGSGDSLVSGIGGKASKPAPGSALAELMSAAVAPPPPPPVRCVPAPDAGVPAVAPDEGADQ